MNGEKYRLYEALKESDKQIECDKCKAIIQASDLQFFTDEVKNEKKETMKVTYFICPECQKVYVVTIKDKRAKQLLACYEQTVKKIDFFRNKKKEPPERLVEANVVARQNYIKYQNFLKRKYGRYFNLKTRK